MPSDPFPFNHVQLSKCVKETKLNVLQLLHKKKTAPASACQSLYEKHQSFYKRSSTHTNTPGRFELFIGNVEFVHNHNHERKHGHRHRHGHYVTINQFADLFKDELPFKGEHNVVEKNSEYQRQRQNEEEEDIVQTNNLNPFIESSLLAPSFDNRNDADIFQHIRNFLGTKGDDEDPSLVVYTPTKVPNKISKKTGKDKTWIVLEHSKHEHHFLLRQPSKESNSIVVDRRKDSFVYDFQSSDDNWEKFLDWATVNNPDGVAIVHPSTDQGTCGSCWSFAAVGSLEANAARNAAMDAFYNEMPPNIKALSSSWKHNDTAIASREIRDTIPISQINQAVRKAQHVESKAFNLAKLSIQELIDCDTKHNQGCIGGNPIMTFPYIHKHGLVSSIDYPYDGVQNKKCLNDDKTPVATTDSWGVLRAKDELGMEFAVRHLGPISVGFNGADTSFLLYSGGVYDSNICSNKPNHAMLITGYGEEKDEDGNVIKYWIARNSWGTGWGDRGYIKIKRKQKENSGVCGISKNPSIAVGGYLIDIDSHITLWQQEHQGKSLFNISEYIQKSIWDPTTTSIRAENNDFDIHAQSLSLSIPSVLGFFIFGIAFLISIGRVMNLSPTASSRRRAVFNDDRGRSIQQTTSMRSNFVSQAKKQHYGSI